MDISFSQCAKQGGVVDFQVRRISFLATTIPICQAICTLRGSSVVTAENPKTAKSA